VAGQQGKSSNCGGSRRRRGGFLLVKFLPLEAFGAKFHFDAAAGLDHPDRMQVGLEGALGNGSALLPATTGYSPLVLVGGALKFAFAA